MAERGAELDAKLAFLSRPESYRPAPAEVVRRETHMSWVFLAGERVYKLKKPVRFPYLDFSTIGRRERACRAELRLNRRLAPDIYLDVVPLVDTGARPGAGRRGTAGRLAGAACGGSTSGSRSSISSARGSYGRTRSNGWSQALARFYRGATPTFLPPAVHLADLKQRPRL